MLNLDPTKLLIIAVVAVILLGPDKLPQVGRQAGAAWRTFNDFRHRMETEVRNSIPDLPSSADIARMARSPSALLNHLSTLSPDEAASERGGGQRGGGPNGAWPTAGRERRPATNGMAADGAPATSSGAAGDGTRTRRRGHPPTPRAPNLMKSTQPTPSSCQRLPPCPLPQSPPTPSTPPSDLRTLVRRHPAGPPLPGPGAVGDPSLN